MVQARHLRGETGTKSLRHVPVQATARHTAQSVPLYQRMHLRSRPPEVLLPCQVTSLWALGHVPLCP
eukprot:635165-Rhodomonas_salina.1